METCKKNRKIREDHPELAEQACAAASRRSYREATDADLIYLGRREIMVHSKTSMLFVVDENARETAQ